jgi:hypothetical protein
VTGWKTKEFGGEGFNLLLLEGGTAQFATSRHALH